MPTRTTEMAMLMGLRTFRNGTQARMSSAGATTVMTETRSQRSPKREINAAVSPNSIHSPVFLVRQNLVGIFVSPVKSACKAVRKKCVKEFDKSAATNSP